jgi:hypothetical protein
MVKKPVMENARFLSLRTLSCSRKFPALQKGNGSLRPLWHCFCQQYRVNLSSSSSNCLKAMGMGRFPFFTLEIYEYVLDIGLGQVHLFTGSIVLQASCLPLI